MHRAQHLHEVLSNYVSGVAVELQVELERILEEIWQCPNPEIFCKKDERIEQLESKVTNLRTQVGLAEGDAAVARVKEEEAFQIIWTMMEVLLQPAEVLNKPWLLKENM